MAGKLQPSVGFVSIEVGSVTKSKKFYEALAEALDLELVYEVVGYEECPFCSAMPKDERTPMF